MQRGGADCKNGTVKVIIKRTVSSCFAMSEKFSARLPKANVLGRSGRCAVQEPFLPPDANWLGAPRQGHLAGLRFGQVLPVFSVGELVRDVVIAVGDFLSLTAFFYED